MEVLTPDGFGGYCGEEIAARFAAGAINNP
jgi:hypothetical protein